MKMKLLCLLLFIATLSFVGCVTDDVDAVLREQVVVDKETIAIIEEMGFKTDDIYVTGDAYIIEGDIMISKERLKELKDQPQTRHQYYSGAGHVISRDWLNSRLGTDGRGTVYIGIDYSDSWSSSVKKDAMKRYLDVLNDAIRDFDNVGNFAINLDRMDGMPNILITYGEGVSMNSDRFLVASIPLNGTPGSTIYINSRDTGMAWTNKTIHPDSKIRASLVHAIGHCLGLGHTGTHEGSGSSQGEDNYAQNQTALPEDVKSHDDAVSIMHPNNTHTGGGPSSVNGILSEGDKDALSVLYPLYVIDGPASGYVGEELTFQIKDAVTNTLLPTNGYTYRWSTVNNGLLVQGSTNQFKVTYVQAGTYTVNISVTRNSKEHTLSRDITITNDPPIDPGSIAPDNQIIGSGMVPARLTNTSSATSGCSYQWQSSTNNSTWNNISGATSSSYQPPALTTSTYYRRAATLRTQTAYSNRVFISVFNITISGDENVRINTSTTYSIPETLPDGVTFIDWTIPGKSEGVDYQITGGINNTELTIEFMNLGQYIVEANFTLPGNVPLSVAKTVESVPLPLYFTNQVVSGNTTFYSGYEIWANDVTVTSGATLTLQAPSIVIDSPFVVEAGAGLVLTH